MSQNPVTAQPGSLSDYYSAAQLRADRWSSLRETTERLARDHAGGKANGRHASAALNLLESLAPIEMYWAFPGHAAFEHLRRLLANTHFDDLSYTTRRIYRALTSGAYRRRTIPLTRDEIDGEDSEDDNDSVEARALLRPYFEVLIVEDLTEPQERWQRQNLAQRGAAARDQETASGAQGGWQAGPRAYAAAHQLHLRRQRL